MILRLFFYLVQIAILAGIAVWFADHPGRVAIEWLDYRIDTSVGILFFVAILLAIFSIVFYRLVRFVVRAPARLRESRRRRRQRKGYRVLAEGMIAAAAGRPRAAARLARRARALLDEPRLTLILSAQAAELNGDRAEAATCYQALRENPATELLGLRGLIAQARQAGDTARALELARRAREVRIETPWVLETLFDLQVRTRLWEEAQATLEERIRRRQVEGEAGLRLKAAVFDARRAEAEAAGDADGALAFARRAHEAAPGHPAIAARLAVLLLAADKARRARRTVEETWSRAPHPDLLPPYRAANRADGALAWVQAVQMLASMAPGQPESRLALAGAALEAHLWGVARENLAPLLAADAPRDQAYGRACRLRAALEEGENADMASARHWRAEAAKAADPVWQCTGCGAVPDAWAPLCPRCGAFDSVLWHVPPEQRVAAPSASGLPPASGPMRSAPLAAPRPASAAGS
ncbi:MAG: heme biosynthesis HemY N-terminal domain-containing protein [Alphaproteobacteria bacterium]